jgi:hypothetical protein
MGDYNDFNMNSPESGKTNAVICHKKVAMLSFYLNG